MTHKKQLTFLVLTAILLMACALVTTPEAASPTSAAAKIPTLPPAPTAVPPTPTSQPPAPTATSAPTSPAAPTPTTVVVAPVVTGLPAAAYLDDRSTPGNLIISLFNAINRHEYLRAYSYWQDPAGSLGSLSTFSNGYANTASVDLAFGQLSGDAGAGQMYYTVPVIIKGTATNGQKANFAACYVVHFSQPGFQAAPPFSGMSIVRGKSHSVALNAGDDASLAGACGSADYPISNPIAYANANLADISKNNYLDNRSGPVEVVSSLENALNRKEYVRAYSYWQNPAVTVGPFNAYAAGFSDTDVITATFGTPGSDSGAGQIHYKVPLAIKVLTPSTATQTFVGCYTLQLAQPGLQAAMPFQPLGIIAGKFKKVDNAVDTGPLLASACN